MVSQFDQLTVRLFDELLHRPPGDEPRLRLHDSDYGHQKPILFMRCRSVTDPGSSSTRCPILTSHLTELDQERPQQHLQAPQRDDEALVERAATSLLAESVNEALATRQ